MRIASAFLLFSAAAFAVTTEDVLAKMDQAAPKFTGMTADLSRTTYTKVIDDKSVESGSIRFRRNGRDVHVLIDFTKPDAKTVGFRGSKAEVYFPKLKTVQEYDLGKHGDMVDQFLLVGFGSTGRDLKSVYGVKFAGEETVAGHKTYRLELTPSAKVKEKIRKLELWISDAGYPVQQRFVQPSGDYYLFTYTNIKLNPQLNDDALKLKLPKGVKREYPQK